MTLYWKQLARFASAVVAIKLGNKKAPQFAGLSLLGGAVNNRRGGRPLK